MSARLPLTLQWNACDRSQWEHYLTLAGRSSVEQCWIYGEAMAACHGQTADRIIICAADRPVAMAQLYRKNLMRLLSVIRIARGPLLLGGGDTEELTADVFGAFRDAFSLRRHEILFWLPELTDTPHNQALMRSVGTRRMVTGLSSAWLDLSQDESDLRKGMTGSWRNGLRLAEKNESSLVISEDSEDIARDMAAYDAFQKQKRFVGPSGSFVTAMANAGKATGDVLVLTADAGPERIAGVVLIKHGCSATYFVSWTSDKGRAINAHNLLLWRGVQALKKSGIRWLDVGGLNTGPGAGVARFKLGLGPAVFSLAGTFL